MSRGHNKPIESRFLGKAHEFQIQCPRCTTKKVLHCNGSSSLPPNVVIKKFRQAGWFVGTKAKDDLCPQCYRKPVAVTAVKAKKELKLMAAPMVSNGHGHAIHYSEVEAIALKLPREQIQQLIKALREILPKAVKPARAPKAPIVIESDQEYARWLEALK